MSTNNLSMLSRHDQGHLQIMAKVGRLVSTYDDPSLRRLVKAGLVEALKDCQWTLTDLGAEMIFHSDDTYRGIFESQFGDWRTKAEARAAGDLRPDQELTVKVFRGGKPVTWQHPETCRWA